MSQIARWLPLVALLVAAPFQLSQPQALAAPHVDKQPAKEVVYWQGTSAGCAIRWTNRDLTLTNPAGKNVYAARQAFLKDLKDYDDGCDGDEGTSVLSVVGPIVSLHESAGGNCPGTAHPYAHQSYRTLDLAHGGKPASLLSYFPASAIYQALMGDSLVKKALGKQRPADLKALLAALDGFQSDDCVYRFDAEMLEAFAFHHLKGDRVAVRIGLSHGCEVARGRLTQLGLYLPIPASLAGPLRQAAAGKQGFLMDHAPDRTTVFGFGSDSESWLP